MSFADPYLDPDSQAEATLGAMITRLEERARHAGFSGMIRQYVATLPSDRALTVLDLGCGTGVVARRLTLRSTRRLPYTVPTSATVC